MVDVARIGSSNDTQFINVKLKKFVVFKNTIGIQTAASALAAGDWNGDDALDLAVANSTGGNNVKTLENTP